MVNKENARIKKNNEDGSFPTPQYVEYPEYYDAIHDTKKDVQFYLDYVHQCGPPILELACGTGRLLIPISQAGYKIYGVDISKGMLSLCQDKINKLNLNDLVSLISANMSSFNLSEKNFSLVFIAVRSFTHLFTQEDQLSCLRKVYEHLRPGGLFIINVPAPRFEGLVSAPNAPYIKRSELELVNGNHLIVWERLVKYDIVTQIAHLEWKFEEYDDQKKLVRRRNTPLFMRLTFRYELQLLLENAGYGIIEVFRDYDKNKYESSQEIIKEIIMVARRPK